MKTKRAHKLRFMEVSVLKDHISVGRDIENEPGYIAHCAATGKRVVTHEGNLDGWYTNRKGTTTPAPEDAIERLVFAMDLACTGKHELAEEA